MYKTIGNAVGTARRTAIEDEAAADRPAADRMPPPNRLPAVRLDELCRRRLDPGEMPVQKRGGGRSIARNGRQHDFPMLAIGIVDDHLPRAMKRAGEFACKWCGPIDSQPDAGSCAEFDAAVSCFLRARKWGCASLWKPKSRRRALPVTVRSMNGSYRHDASREGPRELD